MNSETLLHRQVNPSWLQLGRITSQIFKPTPKDNKCLSVYDGDQISAEGSWEHYVNELEFVSVGVLSVTVQECETLDLPVKPDPAPFPSHTLIDFTSCDSNSQIEKKAKHLKKKAEDRGWQYEANPTE